jgi:MFS family permease
VVIKRLLGLWGNYKVFMGALIIDLVSTFIMSLSLFVTGGYWGIVFISAYIASEVSRAIAFLNLDIFLEHVSCDNDTGGIRGVYLTCLSSAFIIGPLLSGLIITDVYDSGKAYLLGAILLIPAIIIARRYFSSHVDGDYEKSNIWATLKRVRKHPDLSKVFDANFILRFFFAWMVIYTPIFLIDIGFSLGNITAAMAFVLLPFVLLEAPLGKIADKILGEKEILSLGFVIMAISTVTISFVHFSNLWMWALLLFITRIGASMAEIMTETYLFKKIDEDDIDVMSLYRAVRPAAWILGPLVASVFLLFIDIKFLFIILGIITLYGLRFSLTIRDTK